METHADISEILVRMARLDSCAVSDALDALGLKGTTNGLQRRSTRCRIVGRVQTMKLGTKPPEGGSKVHLGARVIEAAAATDIIVAQQSTGIQCACWGGVLANAARIKGIRGVIADGPVRDVDEYEDLDFPVFSRSTTALTARGRIYEQSFNQPVVIDGHDVAAGDMVIADGSGVVFVPGDKVDDVIIKAEEVMAKEKAMVEALKSGDPITKVAGVNYEKMLGTQ